MESIRLKNLGVYYEWLRKQIENKHIERELLKDPYDQYAKDSEISTLHVALAEYQRFMESDD